MKSIVCTLFEGHYHLGVVGLVNSLKQNNYTGTVFAGYRGTQPYWANEAIHDSELIWDGGARLHVDGNIIVYFLPIHNEIHLTNYKPDFMITVLETFCKEPSNIFYFDPDIIVNESWRSFEIWVDSGVAVCEDVNSPMPMHHPIRVAWRNFLKERRIDISNKHSLYANGGFLGIKYQDRNFLSIWKSVQDHMGVAIGGLQVSAFQTAGVQHELMAGYFAPFAKTDQDALNASIEIWQREVSFVGKQAMGFEAGTAILPHALGQPKPWNSSYLVNYLSGKVPKDADLAYWKSVLGPLKAHSTIVIKSKLFIIKLCFFMGRFYKKN